MNSAQDNSAGYTGTTLYETLAGTNAARTAIEGAFGSTHIWSHRIFLVSAFSNNSITGQTILYTDIAPMTLGNVFGYTVPSLAANSTLVFGDDSAQFPLFMMYPFRKVVGGERYWTRDPFSTNKFCGVTMATTVAPVLATNSTEYGLRPSFCIYDPS